MLNHYAYASANPINYTDPTGLMDDDGEGGSNNGAMENVNGGYSDAGAQEAAIGGLTSIGKDEFGREYYTKDGHKYYCSDEKLQGLWFVQDTSKQPLWHLCDDPRGSTQNSNVTSASNNSPTQDGNNNNNNDNSPSTPSTDGGNNDGGNYGERYFSFLKATRTIFDIYHTWRPNPNGGGYEHSGIDVGSCEGDPIFVPPQVKFATLSYGWDPDKGNVISLHFKHNNKEYEMKFGHTMNKTKNILAVRINRLTNVKIPVFSGWKIGYVGDTASPGSFHVHFEIKEDKANQNPLDFYGKLY